MDNFKKAFIRTATKYAEYVELKIKAATEIETTPLKSDNSRWGMIYAKHTEPTVSEQLCEEIRILNAVAAAVGKMEEAKVTEIDLTEVELEEITLAPEQEEELKKKLLFAISKDTETGQVEICPMNEKNCIALHGAEEVKWFINRLWETIQ